MKPLLKNIEHQSFLDNNGYIKLPFLEEQEINELNAFYSKQEIINNTPCFASNTILAKDQNKAISDTILHNIRNKADNLFTNYEIHGGTFLIKGKKNGELSLHQDSTIVDNENDSAYFLWIPLENVTKSNGCMFVIPKSHLFFNNYVSYSLKNEDINRKYVPSNFIEDIEMNKGEILIFSSRLFHGSYTNKTDKKRVAINVLLTNKNASLVYYNKKTDTTISKYIIAPVDYLNSYNDYSKGNLPSNAVFEKDINYTHQIIDHRTLYQKIKRKKMPLMLELAYLTNNKMSKIFK